MAKNENISESVQVKLNNIIEKEGFVNYTIDVKLLNPDGGSYMGVLNTLVIQGETNHGSKEINIFLKNILSNKDDMKIFSVSDVFIRECYAYNELLKVYHELQDSVKLSFEDRFKTVNSYQCTQEAIILENMAVKGFSTKYKIEVVPLKLAELSIQELAKFHALSLVLQEYRPDYFSKCSAALQQPFNFDEWAGYLDNMFNLSINHLTDEVRENYKEKIRIIVDKYPQYIQDKSTVTCICHGDYRHSNILMKEINNAITEVIPIDYQLLHIGCPIHDFLYYIFWATDQNFRKLHFKNLADLYHNTLSKFLNYFSIDVKKVFPRSVFDSILAERMDFGLAISVFYLPFLFACEDAAPDVTSDLSTLCFKVDSRFTGRFRGIVDDFIHWGYL